MALRRRCRRLQTSFLASDDLAAMLTGMRTGESAELRCENGTFELVRDR